MIRILAAFLILCTQVLAVFGTGNLVLCIHDNGEYVIEVRGSECCRAAREASERLPYGIEDDARSAVSSSDSDRCTDQPYRQDQPVVSHGTRGLSEAAREAPVAPIAVTAWTDPIQPTDHRDHYARGRAPPQGPVPRRALRFVLRC